MIVSEAEQSEGRDRRGRSSSTLGGKIIKYLATMSFDFFMKQIVCRYKPTLRVCPGETLHLQEADAGKGSG